jgi:quercetin dioxygenase-like cupin family protein
MSHKRVFHSDAFLQPTEHEPIRSVVTESADAVVIAWHVNPGQTLRAHRHPNGQDTWTVLSGSGLYQSDESGLTQRLVAGDIAVAHRGEVHGVYNDGTEPFIFLSVVCPVPAGHELL